MSRKAESPANGVVDLIDDLLERAIRSNTSDIHFEPTDRCVCVRFRTDGHLHDIEQIPRDLLANIVTRLKVIAGLLSYRQDIPQEGAVTREVDDIAYDLRVSTFPTIRGERVAVRVLPRSGGLRPLDTLGLSESVIVSLTDASRVGNGLICVCGPAGSGKTTTLYALLEHLRRERPTSSFVTVEDPVELRLDGIAQIQVSTHGELTFARALRSVLRQDPQILLIGEIRDRETAEIAIEAALTGHLVLTSLHSGSAADAIVRLLEMGIQPYQLTSALSLVVCQRLLRTVCNECHGVNSDVCGKCLGIGLFGRTASAEAIAVDAAIRAAILERSDADSIQKIGEQQSQYMSLTQDAYRHLNAGRTTQGEVDAVIRRGKGTGS